MLAKRTGYQYIAPLTFWISIFFIVPLLIITLYSFLKKSLYGGVEWAISFDSYKAIVSPKILEVFWVTLYMTAASTIIILCLAIPAAYFMARSRLKNLWLVLVIIPFWTNFLIRIYAWIAILGNNGLLNQLLQDLNIIHAPKQFLYNPYAVVLVLAYTYLPFAILPLYSTIEKFDFSLLEAARDLGATKFIAFWKVLLPNVRSGIFSAFLFSFIPAFGNYAIPQLVGGRDSFMLGNVIARELTITRDWPLSAAISTLITVLTIMGILIYMMQQKTTNARLVIAEDNI